MVTFLTIPPTPRGTKEEAGSRHKCTGERTTQGCLLATRGASPHSLPPTTEPHLLGGNGLIVGAVLHDLSVGQLGVPLLLQGPRQPHPQLRRGQGTALSPRGAPVPMTSVAPRLTCGLMLWGTPASTRERSFSERGSETAILSQVRSPTSWLWVNSRWACQRSLWGGSSSSWPE